MRDFINLVKRLLGPASEPVRNVADRAPSDSAEELVDKESLEFFNALTGGLEIELSSPAQPIGGLLNLAASPDAKVMTLRLTTGVYDEAVDESRPLTEDELRRVVFEAPRLRLRGESGEVITHEAPDGRHFSVRDLLAAVEETERRTRSGTEWLGGVDVHHTYFEGIHRTDDGVWEIYWGS